MACDTNLVYWVLKVTGERIFVLLKIFVPLATGLAVMSLKTIFVMVFWFWVGKYSRNPLVRLDCVQITTTFVTYLLGCKTTMILFKYGPVLFSSISGSVQILNSLNQSSHRHSLSLSNTESSLVKKQWQP